MKIVLIMLMLVGCVFGLDNGIYKVINVVDGDTVDIKIDDNKVRIRLAFIDTMESMRNSRAKKISSKCNIDIDDIIEDGKESKQILKDMVLDKDLNMVFYGIDTTGTRIVGELFFKEDTESVNIKMIKYGKAVPYYTYIKKFKKDVDFYKHLPVDNDSYVTTDECVKGFLGD